MDLDVEEINSVELGLKGCVGGFNYDLVSFYMMKDNVIF